MWARLQGTSFLTDDEKRAAIGYGPMPVETPTAVADFDTPAADDEKYNPYHDELGQFTNAEGAVGGAGGTGPDGSGRSPQPSDERVQVAGKGKGALKAILDFFKASKTSSGADLMIKKNRKGKVDGVVDGLEKEEKDFVEEMAGLGNDVKIIPRGKERTPDFEINGTTYERKKLSSVQKQDSNGISSALSSRALDARGQSPHIIIDGRQQTGMTKEIAERGIQRALGADIEKKIKEILVLTPEGPVASVRGPK